MDALRHVLAPNSGRLIENSVPDVVIRRTGRGKVEFLSDRDEAVSSGCRMKIIDEEDERWEQRKRNRVGVGQRVVLGLDGLVSSSFVSLPRFSSLDALILRRIGPRTAALRRASSGRRGPYEAS